MQSKGNQPSAAQKQWREDVRVLGCIITDAPNPEIHHVKGSTFKHNKVAIGHWWVLPLHPIEHRLGRLNVTDHKHEWEAVHGTQAQLFMRVVQQYERTHGKVAPVPVEAMDAILDLDWKRAA